MNDEKITRIEDKLDKVQEHIASIDVTLVAQHESLKAHMRRSDMLEKHLEVMQAQVEPIKQHVAMVAGAMKLIAILSTTVGIAAGIIEVIKYFR